MNRIFANHKVLLKIFVATGVISIIIFSAYTFLMSRIFQIHNIEIELDARASNSAIFPKIKESLDMKLLPLFGKYVWRVDLEKILKTIESDRRVKDAKIHRALPNTIEVSISPYTPIVNILGNKTSLLYPVARDGEVLPPVNALDAPDSTILRGEIFIREAELRQKAIQLLLALPEHGSFNQSSVSDIYFDKKKGFQLRLQGSGTEIWMGFENFGHRASQVQRVYDYLLREQLSGRIIDARYGKKVVVKLRNEP